MDSVVRLDRTSLEEGAPSIMLRSGRHHFQRFEVDAMSTLGHDSVAAATARRHTVSSSPFGPADEIGMLNLMTGESRAAVLGAADATTYYALSMVNKVGTRPGTVSTIQPTRFWMSPLRAARSQRIRCISGRSTTSWSLTPATASQCTRTPARALTLSTISATTGRSGTTSAKPSTWAVEAG